MLITFGILLVTALLSFFVWAAIHELSHVYMAKRLVGVKWYELKLYPHMYEGSLRWAACRYMPSLPITNEAQFYISLAPRWAGLAAAILLPLTILLNGLPSLLAFIFVGAGVVDLIVGSLGVTEHSDLRVAANAVNKNPWVFRLTGLFVAFNSILLSTLFYFMRF